MEAQQPSENPAIPDDIRPEAAQPAKPTESAYLGELAERLAQPGEIIVFRSAAQLATFFPVRHRSGMQHLTGAMWCGKSILTVRFTPVL